MMMKWAGSARVARGGVCHARAGDIRDLAQRHLGLGCVCCSREKPRSHGYNVDLQSAWRTVADPFASDRYLYFSHIVQRWRNAASTNGSVRSVVCGSLRLSDSYKKLHSIYRVHLGFILQQVSIINQRYKVVAQYLRRLI